MPYIDPMGLSQFSHFQEDSVFNRNILGVRLLEYNSLKLLAIWISNTSSPTPKLMNSVTRTIYILYRLRDQKKKIGSKKKNEIKKKINPDQKKN